MGKRNNSFGYYNIPILTSLRYSRKSNAEFTQYYLLQGHIIILEAKNN